MSFFEKVTRRDTGERIVGWSEPLATVCFDTNSELTHKPYDINYRYRWQAIFEVDLAVTNPGDTQAMRLANQHAYGYLTRAVYGDQMSYVRDAMSALEYGDKESVRQILNTLMRSMEMPK